MKHSEIISRLRSEIDSVLLPAFSRSPYVVLDFPDHSNVGDSLIYLGEIKWFQSVIASAPDCVCTWGVDRSALALQLSTDSTIFLHGGGNLGDIWPHHQEFREFILDNYRGRPVIQLPQSIHYDDEAAADRTARLIERHGAFTLLVRDQESFAFASRKFDCPVVLCPDMAFAMGEQARRGPASVDVLLLLRTDKESRLPTVDASSLPAGHVLADWLNDDPDLYQRALRQSRLRRIFRLWRGEPRAVREVQYYRWLAEARAERGIRQLSSARFVITDRLHVHILCTLLGLPHAFLDNSYGKIGRFSSAFGTLWNGAHRAGTLDEALAIADAYLGGGAR